MIGHKSAFARICRCDQRKLAGIFHMRLCLRRQLRPWTRCDGVRERGESIECRIIPTIPQGIGSWMFRTPPSRLEGQNAGDAGRHHGFIRSRWAHLEHMMTARRGNFQGAFCAFLSAHLCHIQHRLLRDDLPCHCGFARCLTCQVLNDRH